MEKLRFKFLFVVEAPIIGTLDIFCIYLASVLRTTVLHTTVAIGHQTQETASPILEFDMYFMIVLQFILSLSIILLFEQKQRFENALLGRN